MRKNLLYSLATGALLLATSAAVSITAAESDTPSKLIEFTKVQPGEGAVVKQLESVTAYVGGSVIDECYLMPNNLEGITITKAGSTAAIHPVELGEPVPGDDFGFPFLLAEPITEAGTYTLTIAQGTFAELNWETNEPIAGGAQNKAFSCTFSIDPDAKGVLDDYTLTPAEGAVESLSKIQLIFNQLSPFDNMWMMEESAEATISDGTTTYYVIAQADWSNEEQKVFNLMFMDEDYEDATITDGTWTLNISTGAFKFNGDSSPAIKAVYTVGSPKDPTEYVLTPPSGSTISEPVFSIAFPNAKEVKRGTNFITLDNYDDPDAAVNYYQPLEVTKDDTADCPTFILKPKASAPELTNGFYILAIQEGAFIADGKDCEDILGEYTFDASAKPEIYTLSPADGATLTDKPEFTITFPGAKTVIPTDDIYNFMLTNGSDYGAPGMLVDEVEGAADPTFTISLPAYAQMPPNGKIRLIIEEGAFTIDGKPSPEIIASYIMAREISHEIIFEPGTEEIMISEYGYYAGFIFDESASVALTDKFYTGAVIKHNDTPMAYGTDYSVMTEANMLMISVENQEFFKAGTFSITIPADAFTLSGSAGFEISHSWTLVEPKEFTIVMTPDFDQTPTVASLSEIVVEFTNAEKAKIYNSYGVSLRNSTYSYSGTSELQIIEQNGHPAVKITFDPAPTEKGVYTLQIRPETFTLDNTFPFPSDYSGIEKTFTLDPASGVGTIADADGKVTVVAVDGKILFNNVDADDVKGLDKGIYIINGRKTMIK